MDNEIKAMDYLVTKNNGEQFILYNVEIDLVDLAEKMNGHTVQWIVLGGKLLLKNVIVSVEPANIIVTEKEEAENTNE